MYASHWILLIPTGTYFAIAVDQAIRGQYAGFVLYAAYGTANIALLWITK